MDPPSPCLPPQKSIPYPHITNDQNLLGTKTMIVTSPYFVLTVYLLYNDLPQKHKRKQLSNISTTFWVKFTYYNVGHTVFEAMGVKTIRLTGI